MKIQDSIYHSTTNSSECHRPRPVTEQQIKSNSKKKARFNIPLVLISKMVKS